MGAWGASVTGNDLAQDLRSEYTAAFSRYDVPTALEKIEGYVREEICDESDPDEWCDFFYSLADFMWKKGILTEEVKQRALKMIDDSWGLALWEESGKAALNARKKALEKFRAQLLSPMPERKKIKPNVHPTDIFETGDLIAIQLQTADKPYTCNKKKPMSDEAFHALNVKYILLQKIRCHISWTSRIAPDVKDHWAVFRLIDGVYNEVPKNIDIAALRNGSFKQSSRFVKAAASPLFICESSMFYFRKRQYRLIGNFPQAAAAYQKLPAEEHIFFSINKPWLNPESCLLAAMDSIKG